MQHISEKIIPQPSQVSNTLVSQIDLLAQERLIFGIVVSNLVYQVFHILKLHPRMGSFFFIPFQERNTSKLLELEF